jgi:hypothetical protein
MKWIAPVQAAEEYAESTMTRALEQGSSGMCRGCGFVGTRGEMGRHFQECRARLHAGEPQREVFRLHIEGGGPYWLNVDVSQQATLDDLDNFLRAIWLDCCGHLSEFSIGPQADYANFDLNAALEATEASPLRELLTPGESFEYTYDMGSSTELRLHVEGKELTSDFGDAVHLLARNLPPRLTCSQCAAPARWVHVWEDDEQTGEPKLYCGRHGKATRDEQLPVVNSPRMGVCAYTGGLLDDWPPAPRQKAHRT